MRNKYFPYLLLSPLFLMIVAIVFIPLIITVSYSFQSYQLTNLSERAFIGLENYITLFQSDRFISSLKVSIIYIIGSLIGMILLALLTAQIANVAFKARAIFRAFILIPWAVAPVVAAQSWKFMLQADYGIINHILGKIGIIETAILWLTTDNLALFSIILTNVWKTTPLLTLIIVGGLQTISNELYESAELDGASSFQKYRHITLPLIKPFIFTGLIFTTLQTINTIDIVYTMTGGGPGEATEIFTLYNYRTFFQSLDFGLGGAMSVIGVLLIGILISFYVRGVNQNIRNQ